MNAHKFYEIKKKKKYKKNWGTEITMENHIKTNNNNNNLVKKKSVAKLVQRRKRFNGKSNVKI